MKKMYAIMINSWNSNCESTAIYRITDNFSFGKKFVDEKNLISQSLQKKLIAFAENEMVQWNLDNPSPELPEFNSIMLNNSEDNELNRQKYNAQIKQRVKNYKKFGEKWLKANLTKEEYAMNKDSSNNFWSIESVNWL